MRDDWRPNWKERNEYPDAQAFRAPKMIEDDCNYPSKAWAWQFLRRNPAYQKAFELAARNHNYAKAAGTFGLLWFIPYHDATPEVLPFRTVDTLPMADGAGRGLSSINLTPGEIALVFRLEEPLSRQLSIARIQLEEELKRWNKLKAPTMSLKARTTKPRAARKRFGPLSTYLRILDARALNIRPRDIAHHFITDGTYFATDTAEAYIGEKRLGRDQKRAIELMQNGYRQIALTPA